MITNFSDFCRFSAKKFGVFHPISRSNFLSTPDRSQPSRAAPDPDPDSDVDGAPLDAGKSVKGSSTPSGRLPAGFVPSKWETVDPEEVQAQAVTSKWDIFDQVQIRKQYFSYFFT
jgi:hypothetical protein